MRASGAVLTTRRRLLPDALASLFRAFCHAILVFRWFLVSGLLFSVLTALMKQKTLSRPFGFSMLTALAFFSVGRHKVTLEYV